MFSKRRFSRRTLLQGAGALGAGLVWPGASLLAADNTAPDFRIRTITAGVPLGPGGGLEGVEQAVAFLHGAREVFQADGHEVQTLRLATQPLREYLPGWMSDSSMQALQELDALAREHDMACSIGPVVTDNWYQQRFGQWVSELIDQTENLSLTVSVASPGYGVHNHSIRAAAEAIYSIAHSTPGGEGNFRFAATALTPPGSPFFPAAYYTRPRTFSIGLESPNLLWRAFEDASGMEEGKRRLDRRLNNALYPLAGRAAQLAAQAGWHFLGVDTSPAPGLDASIGQAIETLSGAPFGAHSTLAACAAITEVLKAVKVPSCGYSGLMLPVMEDPVLATRAAEGRFGLSELLLYSSVCGTGLDVVPLPGETSPEALAAVITDVAALALRHRKPLSARLFPLPGKNVGDRVSFDNPHLTDSVVMSL
jgi:uncharacterized protein (UPF0210 family)